MKRADTGAANFTTISWGDEILEMVGYEPVLYFSKAIEEAEQGEQNISPSQAASLENQGKLSGEGKFTTGTLKGSEAKMVSRAIVVEIEKIAGSRPGASPGKISDVFETTAGQAGESTTVRVPPTRPTPRRR